MCVCGAIERERECVCVCMYVCMYVCREQSRKVCYLSNNYNGTKRVGSLSCVLVVKNHLLSSLPTICNHPQRKGLLVGLLSLWSLQVCQSKVEKTGLIQVPKLHNSFQIDYRQQQSSKVWSVNLGFTIQGQTEPPHQQPPELQKGWMKHPPPNPPPISHLHKSHTNQHLN